MSWKLWRWQRFQQFVGALVVLLLAGAFLACLTITDWLPGKDFGQDISIDKLDHRVADHVHIAVAFGSCHTPESPAMWPEHWLGALRLDRSMLQRASVSTANEQTAAPAGTPTIDLRQEELTSFERAAIYHSDRILSERQRYLFEAEQRQDRIRRNQLRVLLLSAAGAFLVGMTTLVVAHKTDEDAPFRSLSKGALLPISALALLMPLLSTAISGLVAFDDDGKIALRDLRTVAQLEQLHGRVAEDVTSDPFRCSIIRAVQALDHAPASNVPDNADKLSRCVIDRMQRTSSWEQRHEQILNEAGQSLARAGDLLRPGDDAGQSRARNVKDAAPARDLTSHADPCEGVFVGPRQSASDQPPREDPQQNTQIPINQESVETRVGAGERLRESAPPPKRTSTLGSGRPL
jgi:hypothetical protein